MLGCWVFHIKNFAGRPSSGIKLVAAAWPQSISPCADQEVFREQDTWPQQQSSRHSRPVRLVALAGFASVVAGLIVVLRAATTGRQAWEREGQGLVHVSAFRTDCRGFTSSQFVSSTSCPHQGARRAAVR